MGFSSLSFFGWFAFFALSSLAWLYAAAWLITRAVTNACHKPEGDSMSQIGRL